MNAIRKFYSGVKLGDTGAVFKISKDNLMAFVEGVDSDNILEVNTLLPSLIKEAGLCYGILNPPESQENILVIAKGQEPIPGIDGRIEIVAKSYLEHKKAGLLDNPKNLNAIKNVSKGEIIAKRIHPTPGTPGKDVFGNEIEPKHGEWVPFRPGEFVEIINSDTMAAAASGALVVENDGTISVAREWTIKGDVDFSTGHVEFYGQKLVITGSVLGGFTVETMKDLYIGCHIEDEAIVLAGGNIFVKGIIRSQNTMVKAGGRLECGAIEYSRVFVGKDLVVKDYILNGGCQVHGSVLVTQGKGLVAGGRVLAGGSMNLKTAGTCANVPTYLSAGRDPLLEIHHNALIREQEKLSGKLQKVKEGLIKIKKLQTSGKPCDAGLEAIKQKLQAAALDISNQMNSNKEKIRKIEKDFGLMEKATVSISDLVYPNVKIKICDASLTLKHKAKNIMFFFKDGEIGAKTLS